MDLLRALPRALRPGSHTISPTALYTGQVWAENGLGHPALTAELGLPGRLGYAAGRLAMAPVEVAGGPTLPQFLLARHRVIDHLLEAAVASGEVGQVVELAAGLSPRGLRFRERHPDLEYVEVDLPDMAARKRRALARAGVDAGRHRVVAADVVSGNALGSLLAGLDRDRGVAVVTEGLVNYFPTDAVTRLWSRLAGALAAHPSGLYLSDLVLGGGAGRGERWFAAGLGVAVRGRVTLHFGSVAEGEAALRDAGFVTARLVDPAELAGELPGVTTPGARRVRVVEARTR